MADASDGKMPQSRMKNIMQMFESGAVTNPPSEEKTDKTGQTSSPHKQTPRPSFPPPQPPSAPSSQPPTTQAPSVPPPPPPNTKPQRPSQPPTPREPSSQITTRVKDSAPDSGGATPSLSVSQRIQSLVENSSSSNNSNKDNPKFPISPSSKPAALITRQGAMKAVHPAQPAAPPPISVKPPGLAAKQAGPKPEVRTRTKSEDRANNHENAVGELRAKKVVDIRPVSVVQQTKIFKGQEPGSGEEGKKLLKPTSVKRFHSMGSASDIPIGKKDLEGPVWVKLPRHRNKSPEKEAEAEVPPPAAAPAVPSIAVVPPPKPPRTHAHDHYLETKVTENKEGLQPESEPMSAKGRGGPASQPESERVLQRRKISSSAGEPKPGLTHRRNISEGQMVMSKGGGEEETVYRSVNERISAIQSQAAKDVPGKRGPPPTRPSPPVRMQRPVSIATDSGSDISCSPVDHLVPEGTRRTRPPSSEVLPPDPPGRVHPYDGLVDPNWVERPLNRYTLRRSLSSECLHGSRGTLTEVYSSNRPSSTGSEESPYIDSDGYAIPNKFVKGKVTAKSSLDPTVMPGRPISNALKETLVGIKRIFLPAPSSTPFTPNATPTCPVKEQNIYKVNKRKMSLVKERINQAYAAVGRLIRREDLDETDEAGAQLDTDSLESDSIVDKSEIEKRVTYACSVRALSQKHFKRTRVFLKQIYPQLFEYALIVGLRPIEGGTGYTPYIIHKFPELVDSNVNVPKFCFPDAAEFKPSPDAQSESYSFVLTNIDGGKVFGYCRRVQPRDSPLPEVLCIISPVDGFNMYNTLLEELEMRRMISLDLCQELTAASFGRPLPSPGKVVSIRTLDQEGAMETIFLTRPADSRLENVNYECLLSYLGTDKLLRVVSSLLLERRVLLCSNQLSVLTQTVPAVVALLYPFSWQHTYIPILPPDMLDVCCTPTPFIIGVLASHLPYVQQLPLEEVVIVDLDRKVFIREIGDEATILPKKILKAVKTAINMCKIDADTQSSQWLVISEAFMRIFAETVGHFGNHITTQQDKQKVFQKESFISSAQSKSTRQFLEWFTESQMFHVFISNHLERTEWGTTDLFMTRLQEQKEEREQRSNNMRCLGQKVRDFGRAIKTKLQS